MVALVVVSTFVVLVLGILVAGLLRSHADILRSLHELGAGVGDPAAASGGAGRVGHARCSAGRFIAPASSPPLGPAPAVAGVTPAGDARAVAVDNSDHLTLLGFLSSGCTSCAALLGRPAGPGTARSCPTTPAWSSSPRARPRGARPRSGPWRPAASPW